MAYEYHARLNSRNRSGGNSGEMSTCCRQRGFRALVLFGDVNKPNADAHAFSPLAAAVAVVAAVVAVVFVTIAFVDFDAALMPWLGWRYVSWGWLSI